MYPQVGLDDDQLGGSAGHRTPLVLPSFGFPFPAVTRVARTRSIRAPLARPATPFSISLTAPRLCACPSRFTCDKPTSVLAPRIRASSRVYAFHLRPQLPRKGIRTPGNIRSATRLARTHSLAEGVTPHLLGVADGGTTLSATLTSVLVLLLSALTASRTLLEENRL